MSKTQAVQLPSSIQVRINKYVAQREAAQAHIEELIAVALEAMGHEGKMSGYNVQTGEVILESTSE